LQISLKNQQKKKKKKGKKSGELGMKFQIGQRLEAVDRLNSPLVSFTSFIHS